MKKFLLEVKGEMLKVVWPTRSEITRATALVIMMSVSVSIYLVIFDFLFSKFLSLFGVNF